MKLLSSALICGSALLLLTSPVASDWYPGDGHNMHFPQMPDPTGWDVQFFRFFPGASPGHLADHPMGEIDFEHADDWQAADSSPITEIHVWMSLLGYDNHVMIEASIYADNNGIPGSRLWTRLFEVSEYDVIYEYGEGVQGLYVPDIPEWEYPHHTLFQQVNIEDIEDPFVPVAGETYWLGIYVYPPLPTSGPGWKTTTDTFGSGAVWGYGQWNRMSDPNGNELHLAFVVGPGVPTPVERSTWSAIKRLYY